MIEVNGMAHVILTVNDLNRSKVFYRHLLPWLGLKNVFDGEELCYFVGGRTAIGIRPAGPEFAGERFDQNRAGLHHICLRARSREDVDKVEVRLREIDAHIVSVAQEGTWAPGYYYVLFEDPDGIRIEVNFVPGQGVLATGAGFNPGDDYR